MGTFYLSMLCDFVVSEINIIETVVFFCLKQLKIIENT